MVCPRPTTALALAVTLVAAAAVAGCGAKSEIATESRPQYSEVRVYEVFGMDCPGCHGGLEKLVNVLPGVADSQAAWEQQRLTVYLAADAQVADADVAAAIKKANFTPGERLR